MEISRRISAYKEHQDVWIVSCYYNPLHYSSRRNNLDIFVEQLKRSLTRFLIIECAFADDEFDLPKEENIIQIRSADVLWQKERLLNMAVETLPPEAKYVVWLDADVLFENPYWICETAEVLQRSVICQPFASCISLAQNENAPPQGAIVNPAASFAYVWKELPKDSFAVDFKAHGHTGFAWGLRRNVFKSSGVYDYAIAGGADHLMAHAALGHLNHPCIAKLNAYNTPFLSWARRFAELCQGRLDYVQGNLWHLWHGDLQNRQYIDRLNQLEQLRFDPLRDLIVNERGLFEFSNNRTDLKKWMIEYFISRCEDSP